MHEWIYFVNYSIFWKFWDGIHKWIDFLPKETNFCCWW